MSPESFAEMMQHPSGTDDEWGIHANRLQVRPGHQLVVYAAKQGTRPPRIIGVGTITTPARRLTRSGPHKIGIRWDRKRTLPLSVASIDATYLMQRLPPTKAAVMGLKPELERWVSRQLDLRLDQLPPPPEPIEKQSRSVKTVVVARTRYEAVLRHDPRVLNPFRKRLVGQGWRVLQASGGLASDLVAVAPSKKRAILVEAKTNAPDAGRAEIRYALGQISDYEYFVLPKLAQLRGLRLYRLILLERRPAAELIPFVESLGFGIAWNAARGRIVGGPKTRGSLGSLLD